MADTTTPISKLQTQSELPPQNNDSTTVQEQSQDNLPSTVPSTTLQPNASDVNNLKTSSLSVKSGPADSKAAKTSSGTVISIILVIVILAIAAGLFIASLRVSDKDETKPTVAVGAEDNGALGKAAKKSKKHKKNKK